MMSIVTAENLMPLGVTVAEVFAAAGLEPCGPSAWRARINETRPGVYVLSVTGDPNSCFGLFDRPELPHHLAPKWLAEEPVIYIGRTRRPLRRRLGEFHRHKIGAKSPHRGGQAALYLELHLLNVFWAATDEPVAAEREMIEAFRRRTGTLPFANRCRGTAARAAGTGSHLQPAEGNIPTRRSDSPPHASDRMI